MTRFFWPSFFAVFLLACGGRTGDDQKIQQIDSLLLTIDSAEVRFNKIDFTTTNAVFQRINKELDQVQKSYEGSMEREMASTLAEYRMVTKYVKDFPSKHKRIKNEIGRTRSQLENLRSGLAIKATHDSDGNEMTQEYVNNAFNQEKMIATQLVEEIGEMSSRLRLAEQKYQEVKPKVDSIKIEIGIE